MKHIVRFHQDGTTATCSCNKWCITNEPNRQAMIKSHDEHKEAYVEKSNQYYQKLENKVREYLSEFELELECEGRISDIDSKVLAHFIVRDILPL